MISFIYVNAFRKNLIAKRNINDTDHASKPKNSLKLALLEAMEASSNEDFDVVDVMYTLAKTYKDYYNSSVLTEDGKHQESPKRKTKPSRKMKRSSLQYDVPFNFAQNSYEEKVSYPRAESKAANLFNVPVDDKFLGFLAIPTNQALSVSKRYVVLISTSNI